MKTDKQIETHPIQNSTNPRNNIKVPKVVTMRAYEVYREVFGPQEALITGWCRGGFAISELTAFLYARSFPKEEWSKRVNEAFLRTKGKWKE